MSQLSPISNLLHKAGKKIFGKAKFRARVSMPRLLEVWAEIIAPDDATQILPSRITWKKLEEGSSAGTLYVLAPSALAAKIMYREKIVIERVNRYFGLSPNNCLTRMAITHASTAPKKITPKKLVTDLDPETAERLNNIEDPVLREKLTSLARAMAQSPRK